MHGKRQSHTITIHICFTLCFAKLNEFNSPCPALLPEIGRLTYRKYTNFVVYSYYTGAYN